MPAFSGLFHVISRDNHTTELLYHTRNDEGHIIEIFIMYYFPKRETPFPLAFEYINFGRVYEISGLFRIQDNRIKVHPLNMLTDLLDDSFYDSSATYLSRPYT